MLPRLTAASKAVTRHASRSIDKSEAVSRTYESRDLGRPSLIADLSTLLFRVATKQPYSPPSHQASSLTAQDISCELTTPHYDTTTTTTTNNKFDTFTFSESRNDALPPTMCNYSDSTRRYFITHSTEFLRFTFLLAWRWRLRKSPLFVIPLYTNSIWVLCPRGRRWHDFLFGLHGRLEFMGICDGWEGFLVHGTEWKGSEGNGLQNHEQGDKGASVMYCKHGESVYQWNTTQTACSLPFRRAKSSLSTLQRQVR